MNFSNVTVYKNNKQCIFDQNYLPNTDKTEDITFKFNTVKVVVQGR